MPTTINPSNQTITQYNVQVGGASNLLANVAPSATSGVPVISQGASAAPLFGTAVVAGGGTGQVTLTSHGVLVGAGTTAITQLAAGSAGQVLQSGGASADPAYSTATYPLVATGTGTILRANGTNWVASTSTYPDTNAVSTLLYASSANVMSALATANSGVLTTSTGGVPSIDTTNFAVLTTGVQMKGNNTNTAPPAGFIGEQIRSAVAANGVSVSTNTATNVTSISLTAGIWDVSCLLIFTGTITGTYFEASISSTSASRGTQGDNNSNGPTAPTAAAGAPYVVPSYRFTLSSTTSIYMVAFALYTVGTLTGYGRISATRVG